MKFRPILFSTEMVKAILDGRKTQTRRLRGLEMLNANPDKWERITPDVYDLEYESDGCSYCDFGTKGGAEFMACPKFRGEVGDILWVREAWQWIESALRPAYYCYRADYDLTKFCPAWKPSIHMPKDASRIFLEIADIRVERLQEISEADAKAEGAEAVFCEYTDGSHQGYSSFKEGFGSIWRKINGDESWRSNPWVWAISFRRIDKPENFI